MLGEQLEVGVGHQPMPPLAGTAVYRAGVRALLVSDPPS
jgi:hypothetical protein